MIVTQSKNTEHATIAATRTAVESGLVERGDATAAADVLVAGDEEMDVEVTAVVVVSTVAVVVGDAVVWLETAVD
jgi:hypothetical protein